MATGITVAKFRDVSGGLQKGQFAVGERVEIKGLADLDPIYKALLDRPITVTMGLTAPDGTIGLTPMWFDYEGDKVLVNTASHRSKCGWIRKNRKLTILIVNPDNAYHWVQLKCSVEREEHEDAPGGERVTRQLDKIWTKYTGNPPPYGLRDPAIDEKRVLFICNVDRIATFGKP
jgi:general stress protein 26